MFSISMRAPYLGIKTHFPYLLSLINVPRLIPSIVLFLGTLTVIAPQLRKYHLEKKYYLTEDYTRIPAILEIEEFLKKYAPDIIIKANFIRFRDESTFIYPLGYRKTAIAIPSKFIKSWRADRAGTEAVLLHEIGHYRNGDALILGTGSLFEITVKYSLTIVVFLYIIPLTLVTADQNIILFYDNLASLFSTLHIMKDTGTPNSELLIYFVIQVKFIIFTRGSYLLLVMLPERIMDLVFLLFLTLSTFIIPIIGIWCEELNADRFMLMSKRNDLETSLKTLEKLEDEKSLKSWLLSQVSHPPKALRHWMALHSCEKKSLLSFIFFFPLAYIIQLLILLIQALSSYTISYLTGYLNMQEILEKLLNDLVTAMNRMSPYWLFFAILLLLWPLIAVYWVKFISGSSETYNWENYRGYFFSSIVLIVISIFCYTL
ncbi:M48 family metalloprotease [Methanosarcina sp. MSH10X1]|uniref:M48 family metalloprotease n=1 Tax=Methanosarcina sp. MSH10X1 TaxID=2507075 RepID=UPI0013E2F40E|nr:M48 family metalloprotease [Methanosarcina sp. MSH10X1]